jgi:hypothetical protein
MESYPIEIFNGDTRKAIRITTLINDAPLDLTGASILMQVRKTKESEEVLKEITNLDGITIVDPPMDGIFIIDKQIFNFSISGVFYYDIQITLSNGEVHTYIGGTLTVTMDCSRNE